jgi:hypothetical protein
MDEEVIEGYTDWISPLHDHARVSYAIGESLWGDIPIPKSAPQSKEKKTHERFKLGKIIPHMPTVCEICTPLAEKILDDHKRGDITSNDGWHSC